MRRVPLMKLKITNQPHLLINYLGLVNHIFNLVTSHQNNIHVALPDSEVTLFIKPLDLKLQPGNLC